MVPGKQARVTLRYRAINVRPSLSHVQPRFRDPTGANPHHYDTRPEHEVGHEKVSISWSGPRNPYPDKLGVVEEGAFADLLLVDGGPTRTQAGCKTRISSAVV
jgi:hypothetical protein